MVMPNKLIPAGGLGTQLSPKCIPAAWQLLVGCMMTLSHTKWCMPMLLGRYQAAGEKLAVENFSLADELAKQKLTLQDINEFLTNELKARSLAAAQASATVLP